VEKCVQLPAALEQWAAEHNEQLSADTLVEVEMIASTIASSAISDRSIHDLGDDIVLRLGELFTPSRAERAATLLPIVAAWAEDTPEPATSAGYASASRRVEAEPPPGPAFVPPSAPAAREPIDSPTFLRSDRVDEEDAGRLYGPSRPWKAIVSTLVALALLVGAGIGGWYWFTQRDTDPDVTAPTDVTEPEPTAESVDSDTEADAEPEPTAAPTVEPTPTPTRPLYWADVTPILNSGESEIVASTYVVSPANRAVLTGHTSAITGVVVSDDGRVLTSGADRRLVDWGADVTLASPDVLNVPAPLTVLERTIDQRIIAGDTDGNVTVIDLVDTADPIILRVHDVAISAATELDSGLFAVASVDGDVEVFALDEPDTGITLPHSVEVTAVVGLDDGTIATAAVDGIVRLWPEDGDGEPGEIATLDAPVSALTVLEDGRLAAASVNGDIHVTPATAGSTDPLVLPGHIGAVRALFEFQLDDGARALASGGDDTTVRVWDLATQLELFVFEGHGDIISGIDVLPDGRLVSTSGDGTGRVWDLTLPPTQPVIAPHDWNLSALHAWDNDQFVSGGVDGKVVLASTAETSEPALITQHDSPVVGVLVLESGEIVSLDASSALRISGADFGAAEDTVEYDLGAGATALAVRGPLGIVSGHVDGTVQLQDLADAAPSDEEPADDAAEDDAAEDAAEDTETGEDDVEETGPTAIVIDAHGSGVNDVMVHSTGVVVSAGQDMTVRIIDFDDPGTLPVFDLHAAPVDVVIELPDGRVASAGSDGIYIWTIDGLAADHIRLNGQRSRTISLVGLPGDRLISTGDDGRVRLWDLSAPEAEPVTLMDIPGVVNPYLIQADNGLFVAGAARGYVVFTLN